MKSFKLPLVVCLLAGGVFAFSGTDKAAAEEGRGAVFVMNNAASGNKIVSYTRAESGALQWAGTFGTGGNGSGGAIDPLHSQGSLRLSTNHRLLFAVNAGSNTVTSFAVDGSSLHLLDTEPSGGAFPTALTQVGDLLFVLNAGGSGNVTGFRVAGNGHLHSLRGSTRDLSGSATSPTSLALSPNGQFLVVAESATNKLDVFRVAPNGSLSEVAAHDSAGATPFAAVFAPNGTLIVANASNTISSYRLNWNLSLSDITNAISTEGMATCWDVVTPGGRSVYTANAGSSNLSGFKIEWNGALAPIGDTIVGTNPSGSTNLDTAISQDGRFIYTLNAATGAIGIFSVNRDGGLQSLGQVDGLPASAGVNGIAGY